MYHTYINEYYSIAAIHVSWPVTRCYNRPHPFRLIMNALQDMLCLSSLHHSAKLYLLPLMHLLDGNQRGNNIDKEVWWGVTGKIPVDSLKSKSARSVGIVVLEIS